MKNRIGYGIDAHQLKAGTPLVIGGVSIPFSKGSKGHSDGDVLYHALTDALFGSINAGDIGAYFPSADPQWKYADSSIFVKHICFQWDGVPLFLSQVVGSNPPVLPASNGTTLSS